MFTGAELTLFILSKICTLSKIWRSWENSSDSGLSNQQGRNWLLVYFLTQDIRLSRDGTYTTPSTWYISARFNLEKIYSEYSEERMGLTLSNSADPGFRTDLTSSIQTIQALRFNGRIRFMRQIRSKKKTKDKLVVFRKVLCGTFPICAILCLSDSYTLTSQLTFIWCYKY